MSPTERDRKNALFMTVTGRGEVGGGGGKGFHIETKLAHASSRTEEVSASSSLTLSLTHASQSAAKRITGGSWQSPEQNARIYRNT